MEESDLMRAHLRAEERLPALLRSPDGWQSLDISYHPPRVERLWRPFGNYRFFLHVIHPCTEKQALFHPHPWPSTMRIYEGTYRLHVGASSGAESPPVVFTSTVTVVRGTVYRYEMSHPDGWHAVIPVETPVWTTMLTGQPWKRAIPRVTASVSGSLQPLSQARIDGILKRFARLVSDS